MTKESTQPPGPSRGEATQTSPGPSRAERAALIALLITIVLAVAKVWVWVQTSSLAMLSQALDSLLDVVALALLFFGVRLANKPADESHHYGHAKAENLVALLQTLLIGAVIGFVVWEAVARIGDDTVEVSVPWYALALLATSALVDAGRVGLLNRAAAQEGSDALRAGALNFLIDIGTALVALASLVLVRAGVEGADPFGALLVVAAVAVATFRVGKRSIDVLMDRAPEWRTGAIEEAAASAPGVSETRRVRVRTSGRQVFADVTVGAHRTASLERAHDIAEEVEAAIARRVPGADVVVHVEPVPETETLIERTQAAAGRVPGTHEVHNVQIHSFEERGAPHLHVTLHAKVPMGTSLEQAHDLSEAIERSVQEELGPNARVDTHIEPLGRTAPARDVTDDRDDLVEDIRRLAREEEDVLDCHEVVITFTNSGLAIVAHVRGHASLDLSRIHDASERIEQAIHREHPEVGSVLIHFEPA